ncbi:hypothetical protein [Salinispora arenicola]|uniref:hypothetical protein n=1 Tax=Salinispora arenicola TaxID=168697 RepID=UPI0003AA7F93|nr:hypothetical protein [Salinispora arenicola]
MDLRAVMTEIGTALDTIDAVRVYVGVPGRIDVPTRGAAAVVPYPTRVTYDSTYARGMDRIEQLVLLVVGRPTDRSTLDKLTAYASGGASGVKAAIEAHAYTSCDVVTVDSVDVDDVTYAGVDYLAAVFNLNIVGQGA